MTQRTLSLALRPRKFSQLIGQELVVNAIRRQYESEREPPAWMFIGPTGSGKTTVARILAVSLQCTHGEIGEPCEACWKERGSFSIHEVNASEVSGVEQVGDLMKGSVYRPPSSRRNIYILDEAQRMSKEAQNLSLKYFEDAPETTVWIICTTEPNKILETLKRRCEVLEMRRLQADGIEKLVARAYKFVEAGKDAPKKEKLVEALWEAQVQSPALVLNGVDKYLVGLSAKDAVKNLTIGTDVTAICRAIEKGDWDVIKKEIRDVSSDDLRGIRAMVAGYFRHALEKQVPGPRATEMAKAIGRMAQVDSYTDVTAGPATVALLYELSQLFGGPAEESEDDL